MLLSKGSASLASSSCFTSRAAMNASMAEVMIQAYNAISDEVNAVM